MVDKLTSVLKTSKNMDINEKAIELIRKDSIFQSGVATFVMLEDAKRNEEEIFKIEEPLVTEKEVYKFKYLNDENE